MSCQSAFVKKVKKDLPKVKKFQCDSTSLSTKLMRYAEYAYDETYSNVYPKTDFTYSLQSKDRIELEPGCIAIPNMSRPPLRGFKNRSKGLKYDLSRSFESSNLRNSFSQKVQQNNHRCNTEAQTRISRSRRVYYYCLEIIKTVVKRVVTVTNFNSTHNNNKMEDVYGGDMLHLSQSENTNKIRKHKSWWCGWPLAILLLLALGGALLPMTHVAEFFEEKMSSKGQQSVEVPRAPVEPEPVQFDAQCNCTDLNFIKRTIIDMRRDYRRKLLKMNQRCQQQEPCQPRISVHKVDFALENSGGQVISIRCTRQSDSWMEAYHFLGIPVWRRAIREPHNAIQANMMPGDCFSFIGFPGYLVIQLFRPIVVTSFSLEHIAKDLLPPDMIVSAPKKFLVWGLLSLDSEEKHLYGEYTYDLDGGPPAQEFEVQHIWNQSMDNADLMVHNVVEFEFLSNHGHPEYTSIYRIQVHGDPQYQQKSTEVFK